MDLQVRTDLADECGAREGEGVVTVSAQADGCRILRVRIKSDQAAERLRKPKGLYVTVDLPDLRVADARELEGAQRALAVELRVLAEGLCRRHVERDFSVLVAGLGNREITPDALGPQTVAQLSVTRHLSPSWQALLGGRGLCAICGVAPGVLGQTGIEAVELLRGAVDVIKPDLVIAVDALVARSASRLVRTVQLSDVGIVPGTGVGSARRALTEETLGVPVIALGVPTAIEGRSLVADTLKKAGFLTPLAGILTHNGELDGLLVAPGDVDILVPSVAALLSGSIERAFSGSFGEQI